MTKRQISTSQAPAAIGPYSQAIRANNLLFISGQIPLDPVSGTMLEGTIGEQTTRVMDNIKAIVEAAGGTIDSIVKTTIFLTDLAHFQEVNGVYGSFFSDPPPARATIQVGALPLGAGVEIEAAAALD